MSFFLNGAIVYLYYKAWRELKAVVSPEFFPKLKFMDDEKLVLFLLVLFLFEIGLKENSIDCSSLKSFG